MTRRMPKVDDLIQVEVAELLQRQVKHHDLQDVMLSITRVETSPDLQSARVFISVMDDSLDPKAIQAALEHTEPFIHRELGRRLHMRRIPRIKFILDRSIAEGDRIASLLRGVEYSEQPEEPEEANARESAP